MYLGDCLDVMATLDAVDHVITDPPYTDRTSKGARTAPDGSNGSALGQAKAYITFSGVDGLEAILAERFVALSTRWVVVFCALEQLGAYSAGFGDAWVRATAWLRTNAAPQFTGDRPAQAHEGIAIAHRRGRKRWSRGGHVWAPVGPTINAVSDRQRGTLAHPTPKPEWLMLDAVDAFTDVGETVCDPFTGSGTTGVACLRRGRRFVGVEREPAYFDLAVDRLRAEEKGITLADERRGQEGLFGVERR
jgi:site-specific DNA-methyltransferase (adenine-specific)